MPENHRLTGAPRSGKTTAIEWVAVPAVERGLDAGLVVIDEIAPMQLYSDTFLDAVEEALDADTPVLAAVAAGDSGVPGRIKARDDAAVYRVTPHSRDALPVCLSNKLQ